jgi:hypothetical protein
MQMPGHDRQQRGGEQAHGVAEHRPSGLVGERHRGNAEQGHGQTQGESRLRQHGEQQGGEIRRPRRLTEAAGVEIRADIAVAQHLARVETGPGLVVVQAERDRVEVPRAQSGGDGDDDEQYDS